MLGVPRLRRDDDGESPVTLTLGQFKSLLRGRVRRAGGIRALARELRVNPSHLCQTLKHADRDPDPAIVRSLGYRRAEARYEEAR